MILIFPLNELYKVLVKQSSFSIIRDVLFMFINKVIFFGYDPNFIDAINWGCRENRDDL